MTDEPAERELIGRVTSGLGEGAAFVSLPGYAAQFRDRLGYEPFPGTLDLALDDPERREALSALDPVPIDGWEADGRTFGPARCYPATLETEGGTYEPAHVVVPERTDHDAQLEVLAPASVREALGLADGDRVTVHARDNLS